LGTPVNPNTAIFGMYGQYVLPRGGEIWLGSLIRAMAVWDISEAATRSTVLRLKKKGYLQSRRLGRRAFYRLTDAGMSQLNVGGFRFSFSSEKDWDNRWTVVVYSVPEKQRGRRDALRDSLKWWGFGLLAPGTWISTRQLLPEAEREWQALGVWEYLDVFRSEYLGPGDLSTIVARAFPQLPALAASYQDYIAESKSVLRLAEADLLDEQACFVTRLRNLWEFFAIARDDPVLPMALLPADWPRPEAESLSAEIQHVLTKPAERFFDTIYETFREGLP
jgi:phenylacetic acid degradation operon negative regulatory protein